MKEQLLEWQQKIDALNQRERVLVFLVAVVAVWMFIQTLLLDPLFAANEQMSAEIDRIDNQLVQAKNEKLIVETQLQVGVNRDRIKRRDRLQKERDALDKKIEESIVAMIPPQLMPKVLEDILAKNKGLKLLSIENMPVETLVQQSDLEKKVVNDDEEEIMQEPKNVVSAGDQRALYKHRFELKLQGGYKAAINYFDQLNKLPWRFYWDELHYSVDEYPNAVITLKVHTVSMSEEWIGV